jgi:hypothetical protein
MSTPAEGTWLPDYLDKPVPDTVYHYTSTDGLLGILASKGIWATDIAFLNDAHEFSHGLEVLMNFLRKATGLRVGADGEPAFTSLRHGFTEMAAGFTLDILQKHTRCFVACFCEKPDVLSQWRGYGRDSGFALGFDGAALRSYLSVSCNLPLVPVVYGLEDQEANVQSRIDALLPDLDEARFKAMTDEDISNLLDDSEDERRRSLFPLCIQFKNSAFEAEEEWRIGILQARASSSIQFRSGPLGLTPYVNVRLAEKALPLKTVVVGPGPHAELRQSALELLLTKFGYESTNVEVQPSAIPFRPS